MSVRKPAPVTLEQFLALDEEVRRRHELIDGDLVERGAAKGEHGRAQGQTYSLLGPFNRRSGGPPEHPGGWWFATEVDVRFGQEVLRPDVVGWRRDRVSEFPRGCPVEALPDWTCEVLSTNRRDDLIRKKRIYHRHQVPHYWILDPADETLAVHRWLKEGYLEVLAAERGQRVRAEPFDAIELSVGVFFGEEEE